MLLPLPRRSRTKYSVNDGGEAVNRSETRLVAGVRRAFRTPVPHRGAAAGQGEVENVRADTRARLWWNAYEAAADCRLDFFELERHAPPRRGRRAQFGNMRTIAGYHSCLIGTGRRRGDNDGVDDRFVAVQAGIVE